MLADRLVGLTGDLKECPRPFNRGPKAGEDAGMMSRHDVEVFGVSKSF